MRRLTRMLVKRANAVDTRATPDTMRRMPQHQEPRALGGEAVVAVADGGHGLDGEVEGRQQTEVRMAVSRAGRPVQERPWPRR